MRQEHEHINLVDGYIRLLNNSSAAKKLEIISRLTLSVKDDLDNRTSLFLESFAVFESDKSAEELIADIRASRTFCRQIEPL